MSMAGKIYSIVALLILVAAIIAGVGIYGLREINTSTEQLGRLANRSVNLSVFENQALLREVGTLRMIINTDPAILAGLREKYLVASDRDMRAEIEDYQHNFPENPPPEMVERLAARHGFSYGVVRVKATKSRWGSCSARNDINLSLFLVALPGHLAEYIVLHELCHTVHKNHSERFHSLLDSVTAGEHRKLNRELKAYRPGLGTGVATP